MGKGIEKNKIKVRWVASRCNDCYECIVRIVDGNEEFCMDCPPNMRVEVAGSTELSIESPQVEAGLMTAAGEVKE